MAACLLLAMTGCDRNRPGVRIPDSGAGATWRWRATSMRISALTTPLPAITGLPGQESSSIDVRVAFFDMDGDETKALGMLTLTITSAGRELARREINLSDERRHRQHWDPITETYSLRLPLIGAVEPRPGQTLDVRAVFEGDDGAEMHAQRDVRWPVPYLQAEPQSEPQVEPPSEQEPAQ